jgi:hypothetical protein
MFRLLWRGGELVSRVISLALFASLYHAWVFLVLGLHWLVMLLCLALPQVNDSELNKTGTVFFNFENGL